MLGHGGEARSSVRRPALTGGLARPEQARRTSERCGAAPDGLPASRSRSPISTLPALPVSASTRSMAGPPRRSTRRRPSRRALLLASRIVWTPAQSMNVSARRSSTTSRASRCVLRSVRSSCGAVAMSSSPATCTHAAWRAPSVHEHTKAGSQSAIESRENRARRISTSGVCRNLRSQIDAAGPPPTPQWCLLRPTLALLRPPKPYSVHFRTSCRAAAPHLAAARERRLPGPLETRPVDDDVGSAPHDVLVPRQPHRPPVHEVADDNGAAHLGDLRTIAVLLDGHRALLERGPHRRPSMRSSPGACEFAWIDSNPGSAPAWRGEAAAPGRPAA